MDFRPGLCSACKASFRIPATFTANKAKCSKCGGTVEIGAVVSENAGATPPAASAPPVPAKAIAAPVAAAAARLAAKPEPPPAKPPMAPVKPMVPQRPTAAPVKPAATAAKPAATPAKPAAASLKPATPASRAPAAAAPIKAGATAKPAAKAAPAALGKAKPVAARASHTIDEEADDEEREARRQRLEKKKGLNPVLLGVSAVLSIAVLGGVWVMYQKSSKESAAAAKIAADAKAVRDEQLRKDAAERERLALAAAAEAEKPAAGEVLAAEAPAKPEENAKPAEAKPAAKVPVEGYDLSTIPDFGPAEGTSDEEWTELQGLAALFMDSSAGARAMRAGTKLMETPKKSFPAILNEFKKLNLEDEDGYRNADATQKLLERICKGHNVGWKYEQQENWLQYNQKAIKKWCDLWTKASVDEAFWNGLIKADAVKKDEEGAADGAPAPKKPDDF